VSGLIDVTTASAYFKLSPSAGNTIKLTGTLNNLATIPTTGAQTVFGQSGAGDVLASFSAIPNKYNFELLATAGKWTIGNSLSGTKAGFILNGGTLDTAGFDMGTAGDSEDARFNGGTFTNSGTTTSTVRGAGVYFTQSTTISTPNATGHLDLSKVGYTYGSTIAGITITKTGPGDLHFRSSFTDAGATPSFYPKDYIVNVSAGNLWYDNYSNAGGFAGTYSIATGSTMYLNIPTTKNVTGNITGGGSVVLKTSATLSGANTYTGGTTVLNGATLTFGSAAVMLSLIHI
jgi:fibronectin-binding autotransporter adhesin